MDAPARIGADAHVTLHYRLAYTRTDGDRVEVVSTFGQPPATLQLGNGQLSPGLEAQLVGLAEGEHRVIEIESGKAFGPRSPDLVQRISRATYDFEIDPRGEHRPGDYIRVPGPGGTTFQGLLRELHDDHALLDFNHPLAGQPVTFEVRIIGVLQ